MGYQEQNIIDFRIKMKVKLMNTRNAVLNLLSREFEMTGPPGIMDISDIIMASPVAPSETIKEIRQLFAEGLVDMNSLKTAAFLTPEGRESAIH
jgi:hypothetical protein